MTPSNSEAPEKIHLEMSVWTLHLNPAEEQNFKQFVNELIILLTLISSSFISPDMEEHSGPVPRHAAGLLRKGVFLQRGHAGILLRPRPRDVPAHSELLPHREAPLPSTRVHPGLRRGAGLLRHRARDHRRLLHGGERGCVFSCVVAELEFHCCHTCCWLEVV